MPRSIPTDRGYLGAALVPAGLTLGIYVAYWPVITFGLFPDPRVLYGAYAIAPVVVGVLFGVWRGWATETVVAIGVVPGLWLVLVNVTEFGGSPGIHLPDSLGGQLLGAGVFLIFGLLCSGIGLGTGAGIRRISTGPPTRHRPRT